MAIDRMKHVTLLVPRCESDAFVKWLQTLGVLHMEDAAERLSESETLKRATVSAEEVDANIRDLESIRQTFKDFKAVKQPLAAAVVSLRTIVSVAERRQVLQEFDYHRLLEESAAASRQFQEHQRAIEAAEAETDSLAFFRSLSFSPTDLRALRLTRARIGSFSLQAWEKLRADAEACDVLAIQELRRQKRAVHVCVISLNGDEEQAARVLKQYGFNERALPELEGDLSGRLDDLAAEVARRQESRDQCARRVVELARDHRKVEIVLGYWEARRARAAAHNNVVRSERIAVLCGFIREKDLPQFQEALASEFPGASAVLRDPTPEDNVPVSLTNWGLVKPMRFLVDMFGLPDYFSFDPTPFLSLSFLVFFGMCFGDVVYGILLCLVAGYLSRKSRGYEGINNMCRLFLYCGISTIFFGVITGSWAADLWKPQYLGEGNPIQWIKEHTALIDPLDKAVIVLVMCLGLGVLTQFYGIILKGYGMIRRADLWGAVFDAGLWLVMLPGFLIVISVLFFPTPSWLFRIGVILMAVAGLGLVLTQGRKEEGILARGITGVISLYGIVGSYGCVSFVADALSYSRLLALGLTTGIVGMAFNIMADLVRFDGWLGTVVFFVVVLFGHSFNFLVSIIGAFVHPARLIFLEFFNRFYESGGMRFEPLSLSTESVIVEN